jgi:hypothetical protein
MAYWSEDTTSSRLPSFFAVGPPRTGTTWLHEVLTHHVALPWCKETYFFDLCYHKGLDWYLALFPRLSFPVMGEIAPTYFFSEEARARIKHHAPDAKIICTFREPVARAYSFYRLLAHNVAVGRPFEDAFVRDLQLRNSSRYAHYLRCWENDFGSERVLVLWYDTLACDPQMWIDGICDFIGIGRIRLNAGMAEPINSSALYPRLPRNYWLARPAVRFADWFYRNRWIRTTTLMHRLRLGRLFIGNGRKIEGLTEEAAARVKAQLRDEIEALEKMTGRDLSGWK